MKRLPKNRLRRLVVLLLLFAAVPAWSTTQDPDDPVERRIRVGVRLFPAFLAADLDLVDKLGDDGVLELLVLYDGNMERVTPLLERLQLVREVKGHPYRVEVATFDRLSEFEGRRLGGVFVAEWAPNGRLSEVYEFSRRKHLLVFSPIAGAVDRGVMAGVEITDRIMPEVNMPEVRRAGVRLKRFFLDIAVQHE